MFDRRAKNALIFKDTQQMYQNHENLKAVIENSITNQKLILAGDVVDYKAVGGRTGNVVVSGKRTLEASESYAKQGKRVCVLNFASATNPGGGVIHGSSAQEEAICRCSTLYPCLNTKEMWNKFYGPHRKAENPLYNDDCIFTPSVKVFKSDINFPELLQEDKWWNVDVITCAAPNLRSIPSNCMNPNAGSKKAKIERYIQSLGISAAEKYMMMGYLGYKCTNGARAVKGYINRLPLTKAEKERLYEYCGYAA